MAGGQFRGAPPVKVSGAVKITVGVDVVLLSVGYLRTCLTIFLPQLVMRLFRKAEDDHAESGELLFRMKSKLI